MQIIAIPSGVLRANSYLVTENGTDAVLIDCGGSEPLTAARKRGLQITHVLLTHGHFDHCMGCAALQDAGMSFSIHCLVLYFVINVMRHIIDVEPLCIHTSAI